MGRLEETIVHRLTLPVQFVNNAIVLLGPFPKELLGAAYVGFPCLEAHNLVDQKLFTAHIAVHADLSSLVSHC